MAHHNIDDDQKLKGHSNYHHWSFLMAAVLGAEGLRKTIVGEEADQEKEARAYAILVMSIHTATRVHIKAATSAKELWDTCAEKFGDRSLRRRIDLWRALKSVELDNYDSMHAYVSHVLELLNRLDKVGMGFSDQGNACMLLAGLPDLERDPLVMEINMSAMPLTREKVVLKLLNSTIQPRKGQKKGPKCFQCGQYGHKKPQCSASKPKSLKTDYAF